MPKSGVRAPRKKPVEPPKKVVSAPRPPIKRRVPTEQQRWVQLDERVRDHVRKQKAKRRQPLDLRVDEFEHVIELADAHDETIATVLRACFRFGLQHYSQFASVATPGGAFALGSWDARPPSVRDPAGYGRPGAPVIPPFVQPPINATPPEAVRPWIGAPMPPRPSVITETYDEPVFTPPPPKVPRGYLPSAPAVGEKTVLDTSEDVDAEPWTEAEEPAGTTPLPFVDPTQPEVDPAIA